MTKLSNVRAGFNAFNYSDSFTKDGINYSGTLKMRSAQATYDGNNGSANANIPSGQSFTLGGTTYFSGKLESN